MIVGSVGSVVTELNAAVEVAEPLLLYRSLKIQV